MQAKTYKQNESIHYQIPFSKYSVLIFILFVICFSCKKFVEIDPPTTQLVTPSVFNNVASATAAQTVIYSQMVSDQDSYNLAQATGLQSDELINYSTSNTNIQYYTNSLAAVNDPGPWTNAYKYIYEANAVISGLQNNTAISSTIQEQLTGESLFIRAFWHFYLTNLYGDVPLVTTTNYATNADMSRAPQAQVYQQIITDLKNAQTLLSSNYVDATDTTTTTLRVRPNKWAATALLSRVYLYTGDYPDAEVQSTAVINNPAYSLDSLTKVFLATSTEAIWQLALPIPSTYYATPDARNFILIAPPQTTINNSNTISTQLLGAFEAGDERKTSWIGSYTTTSSPINIYYFPYKYKVYSATSATEYDMVLRLAEQYLIRAEAEAQQNDLTDASADLNTIRARAGLPNSTATTQATLLAAILHERQVELFTEWGNRWFDLIRTGNINNVMDSVAPKKNGSWLGTDSLYPIPQNERELDHNLTQNAGY